MIMRKAFTLIELLVVIAIIAILAVVVVLTLNPGQLILQSRDSNRLSDLASLNSALSLYQTDASINGSVNLGSSSILYVSLPDPAATTTAGSNCASLGLPSLPGSYTYHCAASSTFRKVDGSGWIPVNLSSISSGAPLGQLPIDPVNTSSTGNYLTYVVSSTQYMVTALPESQKQKLALAIQPMVSLYPSVMAVGNTQAINPLFNTQGLVGYWPMDEGTSTVALDMSGSGNNGTWSGSTTNGSYYVAGKVGLYTGNFDGSTNRIALGTPAALALSSSDFSLCAWAYPTAVSLYYEIINSGDALTVTSSSYELLWSYGGNSKFSFDTFVSASPSNLQSASQGINSWYSVCATRQGSLKSIFVNGVFQASTTQVGPLNVQNAVAIGSGGTALRLPFSGMIDDVRIYNRALSAAEVQALYSSQR